MLKADFCQLRTSNYFKFTFFGAQTLFIPFEEVTIGYTKVKSEDIGDRAFACSYIIKCSSYKSHINLR